MTEKEAEDIEKFREYGRKHNWEFPTIQDVFLAGLKAGREEHPAFKQYPCTRDCNRLMRWNTNLGLWQCPVHNKKVKP